MSRESDRIAFDQLCRDNTVRRRAPASRPISNRRVASRETRDASRELPVTSSESLVGCQVASYQRTELLSTRSVAITQSGGEPLRAAQQTWPVLNCFLLALLRSRSQAASPCEPPNKHGAAHQVSPAKRSSTIPSSSTRDASNWKSSYGYAALIRSAGTRNQGPSGATWVR